MCAEGCQWGVGGGERGGVGKGRRQLHTSAVLGTLSQKTSILRSPWVVCSVTDMVGDGRGVCCLSVGVAMGERAWPKQIPQHDIKHKLGILAEAMATFEPQPLRVPPHHRALRLSATLNDGMVLVRTDVFTFMASSILPLSPLISCTCLGRSGNSTWTNTTIQSLGIQYRYSAMYRILHMT